MDHSWRPRPIQGNICPACSTSHFPFCPPPPFPNPSRYHGHNFDPNRGPIDMARPDYQIPSDPHHDTGHWNRNPNFNDFGTATRAPYSGPNHGYGEGGYMAAEYNVNDRSSKRLRVDGMPYGGVDGDANALNLPWTDNERRLKLVRDHGGPNFYPGYNRDTRGYDLDYESGIGLHHGIKRSASDAEHSFIGKKFENHEHGYNHSSYGGSHVSKENLYDNQFQPMPSERTSLHYDQRNNMQMSTHYPGSQSPFRSTVQQPSQMGYDYHESSHFNDVKPPLDSRPRPRDFTKFNYGPINMENQGEHFNSVSGNMGHWRPLQGFDVRPPLPASPPPPPPPPLPMERSSHWSSERKPPSPHGVSSSLFPIPVNSSTDIQPSYAPVTEPHGRTHLRVHPLQHSSHLPHAPSGAFHGESQLNFSSSGHYYGKNQSFPSKSNLPVKSQIVDASLLFKPPLRATRPDHFVIILRGLPGSGKSYLAKLLRDLEVEHGGKAPRIHSIDDYFMTEVDKAEENDASLSSGRGKKPTLKKVLEYCYEPEMEEAYRSSMLKAFKKTLDEGIFTFVIVDDRNLRVADFAQFWATAKRSGYEVYVLEAPYKDPAGCTARNVHGFTQDDVEKMAAQWEETPSLYLRLDVKLLFHGDDLKDNNIQEVDMDTEDEEFDGVSRLEGKEHEEVVAYSVSDSRNADLSKNESISDDEGDNPSKFKDLGSSKWSENLDEEDNDKAEFSKGKSNVLSGLLKAYAKDGKAVHWGDQGGHGFSIGAVKKANAASLVIGPGAGYNLKTNPLGEEEVGANASSRAGEAKSHSVFKERLRAEQESFKAVFDNKRRQRIVGLVADEEY